MARKNRKRQEHLCSQCIKFMAVSLAWIGCGIHSAAWGAVILPIEVMGPPPHSETNTLEVAAGSNLVGAELVVRAHNVSYDDKARITVNGGTTYKIWNDTAEIHVAEPDRSYGGFGGGFGTVTFRMDAADIDLKVGENTIGFTYQWKHPDHGTAGYRIISLDVVDAEGQSLLVPGQIMFDDPSLWEPPLSNPADIQAGKDFFENANIGGIGLSCNNCHTHDGRDFKYFNISNKVIIEQCKKSGFTPRQGQQLASYIRTLPFDAPASARPWNPPYQPGPGTDSRPVFEWAAGAGLDAVLASDAEMLPYIFGSATQDEIDAATDIETDLNLREMPIAVQFPDWIQWIPRVHPMQIWGDAGVATNWFNLTSERFPGWNNPYQSFVYLKDQFENHNLANRSDLVSTVDNGFQRNVLWWIGDGRSGHPWTDLDGKILDIAIARGYTAEKAKLELSRWRAVKLWGLFNAYDAEDKALNHIPTAEKYQWPAPRFSTFQIAAHFIGDNRGTSIFAWESLETGTYFSSIWYQLQMVLNSGMHQGRDVSPVDWAYNFYHINRLGKRTGIYEPLRLVQNLIKCYQQRRYPGETISKSVWSMREVSPWRLYSDFDGDLNTYNLLDSYDETGDLRLRILRSMLKQFMVGVGDYEPSDWPRTSVRDTGGDFWYLVEDAGYVPVEEPDDVTDGFLFSVNGERDAIEADAMYRLLPRLNEVGLEPSALQELSDWCSTMWTNVDWQVRATDSDGDSLHDYWEGLHYGTLAWGPHDDPNSTGMSNRDAYLYGASSNRMDFSLRVKRTPEGDAMDFVYERPRYVEGTQFRVDYSTNLVTWQTGRVHTVSTSAIDELYESVTERHPLSSDKSMFFRLQRIDDDPDIPSVQFAALSDGDKIPLGEDLDITAHVTGISPANIALVKLNIDGRLHSRDFDAPYTFHITGLGAGSYDLKLWLRDSDGVWLGSDTISIMVGP